MRIVLIATSISACEIFRCATFLRSVREYIIALIGKVNNLAIIIPSIPEVTPKINVSASKTLVMSFFLAPRAFSIPISFVLSRTEVYVIIAIIIKLTIKFVPAKAISTIVIPSMIPSDIPEIILAISV